jgi:hypothetical protein
MSMIRLRPSILRSVELDMSTRKAVAVALLALDVDAGGGGDPGPPLDHVLDQPVGVEVVAVLLVAHLAQRLGAHQLEVAPDLGHDAPELVEGRRDEPLLRARLAVLGEDAPGRPVVLDLVVPFVVVEDPLAEVLLVGLRLDVGHLGKARLGGGVRAPALGVVRAPVGGARGRLLVALGGGLLGDLVR